MSTRATITVRDDRDTFSIYHHSDGYPDHIFPKMREALTYAWELPRFEAMDFAAAIVAACKKQRSLSAPFTPGGKPYSCGGGGVYFTTGRDAHGDTEWHYDVSFKCDAVVVRAYERNWKALGYGAKATGEWRYEYCTAQRQGGWVNAYVIKSCGRQGRWWQQRLIGERNAS